MNTPKTPKRFDIEKWKKAYSDNIGKGSGDFTAGIEGAQAAGEFALLVSEFTHLEYRMEMILARLIDTTQWTASLILRSILSAQARINLMKGLLERGRQNTEKSLAFDEIIAEFSEINKTRNIYVHARWLTDIKTGQLYIVRPTADPLVVDMAAMEAFEIDEFQQIRRRIVDLCVAINKAYALDVEQKARP